MTQKNLVGFSTVSYTNKNGKLIEGYNLFFSYDISSDRGQGIGFNKDYVSKDKVVGVPALGQCSIEYGSFNGKAYISSVIF